jgi:hypothetical protein
MPRGGFRENAGRKSEWASGRTFSETKPIRVPREHSDTLLEIAHRLDAGEAIDLDTESLQQENQHLKEQVNNLKYELDQATRSQPVQLSLLSGQPSLSKSCLEKLRDESLSLLQVGQQSSSYAKARKAFNHFIKKLLEN